ncbi:hypothetical protein WA026_009170 [Henosepilachna vigintioctopunctata]|uniref:Uncharacterized protein n=1 Tax=Henosepilachna vigintioctopunctata TaxID=420089 RepID=A0AAW1UQ30_9CUCU
MTAEEQNKGSRKLALRTIPTRPTNRAKPQKEILPLIETGDIYHPVASDSITDIIQYLQHQYAETQDLFEWDTGYDFHINRE